MSNQDIVSNFEIAIEMQNKEAVYQIFAALTEKANDATKKLSDGTMEWSEASDIVLEAQSARVAMRHFGAPESTFANNNF